MKEATRNFSFVVSIVFSTLVVSVLANPAGAVITTVGEIDPVYDGLSDPWNILGDLKVGINWDGSMAISSGSTVADSNGYVGYDWGGSGTVTVAGASSLWENYKDLFVGTQGAGDLTISNGAKVMNRHGYIGYKTFSFGDVLVTDPNSLWQNSNLLCAGYLGDGHMVISNGARVDSVLASIGNRAGGAGTVTVTGPDSLWDNDKSLSIGLYGDADMLIEDGAKLALHNGSVEIGVYTTGDGTVTVTGQNSLLENPQDLYVGKAGTGSLTVSDGGTVTNRHSYIGYESDGTGAVTVTEAPSLWNNAGDLYLGYAGYADVVISNGGRVTNSLGYIGYDPNAAGRVTLTGSGSLWQNAAGLNVGYKGDGQLNILDGASVTDPYGYIGLWGDEITDANGVVTQDSQGAVTVSGSGSLWQNSTSVFVGVQGQGLLTVSDGGQVVSSDGLVGSSDADWYTGLSGPNDISWSGAPSSIGTASITGEQALWQNLNEFSVGCNGGEGDLVVADGGMLTGSRGFVGCFDPEFVALAELGYIPWSGDANSVGQVLITGPNSLWVTGSLLVGGWGGQGDLMITGAGRLVSPLSLIGGFGSNSLGLMDPNYAGLGIDVQSIGRATVTGPNSVWDSSTALFVGSLGGQGELTISDGGTVTSSYGLIGGFDPVLIGVDPNDYPAGVDANSVGLVTVTGPNSVWDNSDGLYVGGTSTGPGGTGLLRISNAGLVQADEVTIWSTGTIGGDATLTAPTVRNFGTLGPGNSIGTLTIDGNLTMEPNSILEVEIDNSGNGDKLIVTGDVSLAGGTVKAISAETITGWHEYTIMEANSVAGTFDALDTALLRMGIVDPLEQLNYEIDSVLLRIVASHFDDPNIARTDNHRALGSALQQIADGGGNSITTALQGLSSNAQVRAAYADLSGSPRAPLSPIAVANTTKFVGTVADRMHCARTGMYYGISSEPLFAMARPDNALGGGRTYDVSPSNYMFALGDDSQDFDDQYWGIWAKAYGLYGDREDESGVPGYVYKVWGWSVGHDYWLTDELLVGVTGSFSDGYVDYTATSGQSDVDSKHIGFYSSYNGYGWYLDSVLTYGWVDYKTERSVGLMGEQLDGEFEGRAISGYFEAGFDWYASGGWLVQPLASFQVSRLDVDGYTETGGASALVYDDQRFESYKASIGVRLAEEVVMGASGLRAGSEVRARWVHEFGDVTSSVDAHFASNPATVFTVSDGDASRDSAVLGVGFHAELSKQMLLFFDYDTSLNGENVIHVLSGGLVYRW